MENISDKKKAIFESTLELIKDNGFHGTPMSLVAKKANVAAGTIYHYFESKDELICELYTYNKNLIIEIIASALAAQISYEEKFYKIWCDLYCFYVQNTNVLVFFEQYLNSPYSANKCPGYFQGELRDFLQQGINSGRIKNIKPEILIVFFLGSITSAAKLNMFGNIPLNEKDLKEIGEVLWKGIEISS